MVEQTESILVSIKKLLGIDAEYKHFAPDIIMHINSVFSILTQLGVGPSDGFSITNDSETWTAFIGEEPKKFALVKTYMQLKVRLMFDPPLGAAVIESINRQISEFEWRLCNAVDPEDDNRGEEEV